MQEAEQFIDLTRNASLRSVTNGVRRKVAEMTYHHTPIRANELSVIGAGGNILGSALAARNQDVIREDRKQIVAPLLLMACAVADAFDGELGRVEDRSNPGHRNQTVGMLFDVVCDRVQEGASAKIRKHAAYKRGDKLGELMASGAAITNTLPSTLRAFSEALGQPVAEAGNGVIGFIGTRPGRAASNILSSIYPEHQAKLDTISTAANLIVTAQRIKSIIDNKNAPATLSEKVQEEGKIRAGALLAIEGFATAATIFTFRKSEE